MEPALLLAVLQVVRRWAEATAQDGRDRRAREAPAVAERTLVAWAFLQWGRVIGHFPPALEPWAIAMGQDGAEDAVGDHDGAGLAVGAPWRAVPWAVTLEQLRGRLHAHTIVYLGDGGAGHGSPRPPLAPRADSP
jgi:hypothetical protein